MSDCVICDLQAKIGAIPPREQIYLSDEWRVSHAWASLEGWLVVCPRRHVEAIDELNDAELASIGGLLGEVSSALRTVIGCEKTYVVLFAEQQGFAHLHFHVVPRMPWFTREDRGPNVSSSSGHQKTSTSLRNAATSSRVRSGSFWPEIDAGQARQLPQNVDTQRPQSRSSRRQRIFDELRHAICDKAGPRRRICRQARAEVAVRDKSTGPVGICHILHARRSPLPSHTRERSPYMSRAGLQRARRHGRRLR